MIDLRIGNALSVLRTLPSESVHCCVTSPPYFNLRTYGVEPTVWDEPDIEPHHLTGVRCCRMTSEHTWTDEIKIDKRGLQITPSGTLGGPQRADARQGTNGQFCVHCGAWKGCLGNEPTPELYVKHLVAIFREVRRVLRSDGSFWCNISDSYNGNRGEGVDCS